MEAKSEQSKRSFNAGRCVGALACDHTLLRFNGRKYHTANNRTEAMKKVDECLQRGSAVAMKNVAGDFVMTEIFLA